MITAAVSAPNDGALNSGIGMIATGAILVVGALGEWNFADRGFLAAGPGIGHPWSSSTLERCTRGFFKSSCGSVDLAQAGHVEQLDGLGFSFNVRTGVTLGERDLESGFRQGFTIGIDCRVVVATQAIQGITAPSVGVIPTLMLGYDFR
jgi:hypothetical protein